MHRAVERALTPGELAGLRKGERVARSHDVFLRRPPSRLRGRGLTIEIRLQA